MKNRIGKKETYLKIRKICLKMEKIVIKMKKIKKIKPCSLLIFICKKKKLKKEKNIKQ